MLIQLLNQWAVSLGIDCISHKKYIDALCGLAVTSLCHSNKEITEVLKSQSTSLIHTSNAFHIKPQQELAKRLCQLSGMSTAFFCNSGAEATEGLIKLARKYHHINKTA